MTGASRCSRFTASRAFPVISRAAEGELGHSILGPHADRGGAGNLFFKDDDVPSRACRPYFTAVRGRTVAFPDILRNCKITRHVSSIGTQLSH